MIATLALALAAQPAGTDPWRPGDVSIEVTATVAGRPGQSQPEGPIRFTITYNSYIARDGGNGTLPSCGQVGAGELARWSCNINWPVDIAFNGNHFRYLINSAALRFSFSPSTICFTDAAGQFSLCLDGLKGVATKTMPRFDAYKAGVTATLVLKTPNGEFLTVENPIARACDGIDVPCANDRPET